MCCRHLAAGGVVDVPGVVPTPDETASDTLGLDRYMLDDEPARWSGAFLRTLSDGRPVPIYGSTEWLAEQDYRLQIAAAVLAGEAWRRDGLFLGQTLEDDLAHGRYLARCEEAQAFGDAARHLAGSPSHAVLVARRAA